jgi:hypothetical protein
MSDGTHWYLCATCKTPGCGERQLLKYLGAVNPKGVSIHFPVPFEMTCLACGKTHDYSGSRDSTIVPLSVPPSDGFHDKF